MDKKRERELNSDVKKLSNIYKTSINDKTHVILVLKNFKENTVDVCVVFPENCIAQWIFE